MTKYWIAVASAEHARRGKAGFMQVNHGKKTPLQRIRAGDGVTYYSPAETIGGKDRLQSFTTIGRVRDEEVYQGVMGGDFTPWRRNVDYVEASDAPIALLLDELEFTRATATGATRCASGCSRSASMTSARLPCRWAQRSSTRPTLSVQAPITEYSRARHSNVSSWNGMTKCR